MTITAGDRATIVSTREKIDVIRGVVLDLNHHGITLQTAKTKASGIVETFVPWASIAILHLERKTSNERLVD